jgi:lipopolysaccharide/colanic/teichoic acid biosynthesis glycosyltransferase
VSGEVSGIVKRSLDVLSAAAMLLLVLPLLLFAVVAVRLSGPGPILFRQVRIGRDGRPFDVLKLRTMHVGAEERLALLLARDASAAAEFARFGCLKPDPRVAGAVGRWLRRWSVDELPQLWNVLRGDMSMVGPRPLPVIIVELLDPEHQRARATVRPGLTGPYQVYGRCDLDLSSMRELDLAYVAGRGIGRDLALLLRTPWAVVSGAGAF